MRGQVTSPLGERARTLIEQARNAHEPSASSRARVQWRVELNLASQPAPRRLAVRRWVAWWFAGAGVALASSAAALFWQGGLVHESAQTLSVPPPEVAKTPLPAAQPPPSEREETESEKDSAVQKTEQNKAPPSPRVRRTSQSAKRPKARQKVPAAPAQNSLGAETQAIAQAQTALSQGEPKAALRILRHYDQQYRNGVLTEERSAARILALCATGQKEAAHAEANKFAARWPRSPQIARLRISCAKSNAR